MKRSIKLTLLLTILVTNFAIAQRQWGIKINGGLSRISNLMKLSEDNLTTFYVPSVKGGIYYNFSLSKRSSFGAELLFSQIEGKEKLGRILIEYEGNNLGYFEGITFRHISYLSVPFYYGYTIKRLTINGGFQVSYVLASNSLEKNELTYYGIVHNTTDKYNVKTDGINIKKFDLGPSAGVIYKLTDKLAVEGTYYYGFNNIQKDDSRADKLKVQQVTLGIRYTLWGKKAN